MRPLFASYFLAFVALASSRPTSLTDSAASPLPYTLPRLALYYQTYHDYAGNPISMLPLIREQGIAMTHIFIAAFHVSNNASTFYLNDFPPSDPCYDSMWSEVKMLQAHGVRVLGMVGGASPGSFDNSTLDSYDDTEFEDAYAQLHTLATTYQLNGFDLDVEQPMSQSGIERLVKRLKTDFGPDFEVTLAPVAKALSGGPNENLSGFSYGTLETEVGGSVAFYNAQFYNGWGSMSSPDEFEAAVNNNSFAANKVCVGVLTNSTNGGSGYVNPETLGNSMAKLASIYGKDNLCGVTGWEYFNALPGSEAAPWKWAQIMTSILRPDQAARISLKRREAEDLTRAWERSKIAPGKDGIRRRGDPSALDYFALVLEE